MSEDVIVIGSGPAGATAAYILAKEGFEPIVLERGGLPGNKTVYGGKVHAGPLRKVFGEEFEGCPVERWVTRERLTLCSPNCSLTLEYRPEGNVYFTAYLPKLSRWISKLAEEAGAMVVTESAVEKLIVEGGAVKGVVTEDGEKLEAKAVVVAEGANRLVLERSGLARKPSSRHIALGAKYVVKLEGLEERLGVGKDEGVAWLFMGFLPYGGGFLYTFGDKISVGVVLHDPQTTEKEFHEVMEDFRHMSPLAEILEGGELVEYAAHITSSGINYMLERPYGNGYVVVGDAAGLLANHGFAFRGVDHAVYSGYLAGRAVAKGLKLGNVGEALAGYWAELNSSIVMKNMRAARRMEKLLRDPRLYREVPKMITSFVGSVLDAEVMPEGLKGQFFKVAERYGLGKGDLLSLLWRLIRL